jgi:hypothetical protein
LANAGRATEVSLANAKLATQVSIANADAQTQVSIANANNATNVSITNANSYNQALFQNANALNDQEKFNLTMDQQIAQFNATAFNQDLLFQKGVTADFDRAQWDAMFKEDIMTYDAMIRKELGAIDQSYALELQTLKSQYNIMENTDTIMGTLYSDYLKSVSSFLQNDQLSTGQQQTGLQVMFGNFAHALDTFSAISSTENNPWSESELDIDWLSSSDTYGNDQGTDEGDGEGRPDDSGETGVPDFIYGNGVDLGTTNADGTANVTDNQMTAADNGLYYNSDGTVSDYEVGQTFDNQGNMVNLWGQSRQQFAATAQLPGNQFMQLGLDFSGRWISSEGDSHFAVAPYQITRAEEDAGSVDGNQFVA